MDQLEDNLGVGTLICCFHARAVDVALRERTSLGQAFPASEHLREQFFLPVRNDGNRLPLVVLDNGGPFLGSSTVTSSGEVGLMATGVSCASTTCVVERRRVRSKEPEPLRVYAPRRGGLRGAPIRVKLAGTSVARRTERVLDRTKMKIISRQARRARQDFQ